MESYGHFSPFYRLSEAVPLGGWLVRAAMPDERPHTSPWHTRSLSSERKGLGAEEGSPFSILPRNNHRMGRLVSRGTRGKADLLYLFVE